MTIEMMILTIDGCKVRSMVNLTETYRYGFIFTAGKVCPRERVYEDFALLPLLDVV